MADGQGGDPAQAFEDLRAEVSVLRRAIEALPEAMRGNRALDYSEDLAVLGKGLDEIRTQLDTVLRSPTIRRSPEEQGHAIAEAGAGAVREAARRMGHAILEIEGHRGQLAAMTGEVSQMIVAVRTDREQTRWLCWIAALGLACGLVLSPVLASVLPFGLNARVATLVMRVANARDWDQLVTDDPLVRVNREAINACGNLAARKKHCVVTLKAPGAGASPPT